MNGFIEQVGQNLAERELLPRGRPVLVAVSGGVDSMVLLHVLHELARAGRWPLTVAHLNHHLRGHSSDADERLVRRAAQKLGLPCVVGHAQVRRLAQQGSISIEMAARQARHTFLAKTAERLKIRRIALAHHADDQVELFFLRLFRGAGSEGLAGMRWCASSPANKRITLVRPLLAHSKRELREFAAAAAIAFREDKTNASLDFQRNRIRHELLPLLQERYQPALHTVVPRLMEILGAEAELVNELAAQWLGSRTSFDALPVPVQRRALHRQLPQNGIQPEFDLVEHLRQCEGKPVQLPSPSPAAGGPSLSVARTHSGRLEVSPIAKTEFNAAETSISLSRNAGALLFGGTRFRWRAERRSGASRPKAVPQHEVFDADAVGPRIVLRYWRPGDRFQPIGTAAASKLQDIFVNQKIDRASRHKRVVAATAAGDIFWVEGLRISERFKLTRHTIRRLHWHWQAA